MEKKKRKQSRMWKYSGLTEWEFAQAYNIMTHTDSFDREIIDSDGNTISLHDLVGDYKQAHNTRIRAYIRAITKTKQERQVVELLLKGYNQSEVGISLNLSRQRIDQVMGELRNRAKKNGFIHKK